MGTSREEVWGERAGALARRDGVARAREGEFFLMLYKVHVRITRERAREELDSMNLMRAVRRGVDFGRARAMDFFRPAESYSGERRRRVHRVG